MDKHTISLRYLASAMWAQQCVGLAGGWFPTCVASAVWGWLVVGSPHVWPQLCGGWLVVDPSAM